MMKLSNEARIGLMVTVSFTIFLILVGILAKINIAQKGYNLSIYFSFLNDLRVSAPLKIGGGIKIGHVQEIKQSAEKTEVIVWIDKKYKLVKTTRFAIFTAGIIGEKYINVFVPPTLGDEEFLSHGDVLYGIDPASFDQMMLTLQGFMTDERGGQILGRIFENSNSFVDGLNRMVQENRFDVRQSVIIMKAMMANMSTQTKTLIDQLNVLTRNMAQISERNKEEVNITLRNLSEVSSQMNKIALRLESGRGTLGKLLSDEEVYYNIRDASIFAKDLFRQLKSDPSKLFFRPKQ